MGLIDGIMNVLDGFIARPIGLYNKSYRFMVEHLDRNIGTGNFDYDGFSTPIGTLCNPYYNTIYSTPWFIADNDKMSYSNYLDYMRGVYGATLSVSNINTSLKFVLDDVDAKVGYIDGKDVEKVISSNGRVIITNPNMAGNDTSLGKTSNIFLTDTMLNSIDANDARTAAYHSISEPMKKYFGLNSTAFRDGILGISSKLDKATGRYGDLSPLTGITGPLDETNYGTYKKLGTYEDFYKNSSTTTRELIDTNVSRNKYNPIDGEDYLTSLKITVGNETLKSSQVRYIFTILASHKTLDLNGSLWSYAEAENGVSGDINGGFNNGIKYGYVTSYGASTLSSNDLLKKTNDNFRDDKYKTLIARFHTKSTDIETNDPTQTAVSKKYGMSKGRNLLKVTPDKSEGYDNPYCRVWTYHHQYHRLKDVIRPLLDGDKPISQAELEKKYNFNRFRTPDSGIGSGGARLDKYGSMHSSPNGLVNISPIKDGNNEVSIKNCMFSIENLAWKKMYGDGRLSDEQRGPFGGRIMWFPPYGLSFNESVNVSWNQTQFIGRGEDIYTYTNTTRTGTLSFYLLIDHPSILDYWNKRNNNEMSSTVDDIESSEQQLLRFFAGCDMLTAQSAPLKQDNQVAADPSEPKPETIPVTFMVFYPNDLSGEGDVNGITIPYLINGVGAGKTMDNKTDYSGLNSMRKLYSDSGLTKQVGGYEIRDVGVSVITSTDNKDKHITDVWWEDGTRLSLGKQIDNKYPTKKWAYRIDNSRAEEVYRRPDINYVDTRSFGLNSGLNRDEICQKFKIDEGNLYSLTDIYVAFMGAKAEELLAGRYSTERVAKFNELLNNHPKIQSVEAIGFASSHGSNASSATNKKRNKTLGEYRAETIVKWLRKCIKLKNKNIVNKDSFNISVEDPKIQLGEQVGDVSDLTHKLFRAAKVTIYFEVETTKTAQEILTESNTVTSSGLVGKLNTLSSFGKTTTDIFKNKNDNLNKQADGTTAANTYKQQEKDNSKIISPDESVASANGIYRNEKNSDKANVEITNDKTGETDMKANPPQNTVITEETVGEYHRYDEEAEFFRLLSINDPVMRHKLTDKIKYFDPAYHSISPEGFNARLTFLHQCTRQGPTIGASDEYARTANNLAFGRQPVCILRLGDFYYTKIVIQSVNIDYDPLVWDLNSEGIGVMPMLAKINIGFTFIGGSDIAGPIARLQNAVSFNYYANTEVYDDRSEQIEYNDDHTGKINKIKLFP